MQPHTKLYMTEMGYTEGDWIPCEVCGGTSVDIHHLKARGMGGTKKPDTIENLMAVCRACHVLLGDKKQHMDFLREKHQIRMDERIRS